MGQHSRSRTTGIGALVALTSLLLVLAVGGGAFGVTRLRSSTVRSSESVIQANASRAPALQVAFEATVAPTALAPSSQPATDTTAAPPAQPATGSAQLAAPAPPPLPAFSAERYLGKPIRVVPNRKREVALTFDDGPGPDTGKVLEILAEHDTHATFFVVGRRARRHSSAVRDMAEQGHEVANHTWSHPEPGEVSESALDKQYERNQKLITKLTGQEPRFARTRGGKFTDTTMENLTSRGLILALWTIHSNDVEPSPSPEQIVRNATGGAESGSIILLHETNPNTILALPAILRALERKGLHPVTLSQLVADDTRGND